MRRHGESPQPGYVIKHPLAWIMRVTLHNTSKEGTGQGLPFLLDAGKPVVMFSAHSSSVRPCSHQIFKSLLILYLRVCIRTTS